MAQNEFLKALITQAKVMSELRKEKEALEKKSQEVAAELKKVTNPVFALTGFVAAYMGAVKNTDGLVSVMPSCLKALQTAEKSATVATVSAAIKGLDDQEKAAQKQAGSDAGKKKIAAQFTKELDQMKGQLTALL